MTFPSICHTQTQVLYAIQQLHNGGDGIELDPMFNKGSMYGDGYLTPFPKLRFDINPLHESVVNTSADALPIDAGSIRSMVLDPPWLIHSPGTTNKLSNRYGYWRNKEELITFTKRILDEGSRVLKSDGLLIFKCQDFIHNRRKFFYSLLVRNYALKIGFNLIDEMIFVPGSRQRSQVKGMNSYASHSLYTYFLVFRKKKSRTDYRCVKEKRNAAGKTLVDHWAYPNIGVYAES